MSRSRLQSLISNIDHMTCSLTTKNSPRNTETVATLPGDLDLIPIAEALKSATSRTGGKPNVIARGPEPCSPGISRARSRIGPGYLATVSKILLFPPSVHRDRFPVVREVDFTRENRRFPAPR